ncbi:MAG TPA: acyl-CoA dehydrogenase [Syntrophomonas sp.]|nr:acyl-CoA dehydrogenase [Syntrophomonas sp.]
MAHSVYLYQTRDIRFQIKEWLDSEKLISCDAYKDYYGLDDFDGFLDVAFKICRDVLCPTNKDADEIGMKFVGGNEHAVVSPDSFKNAYNTICEAGLGPQYANRSEEGRMPLCWYAPILEMQSGASPGIVMFWCLTAGATTVIQNNASEELKERFLPKMFSGEWGGTMGLTEPGAGSDVGACSTKCFPTDTPGLYKIKGQKCFITSGDHDLAENIVHLVLAKTPDGKPGTAGINCLIVPKFWVNEDGSVGAWNDVISTGIEHKMGIHGSSTLSLSFGENDNCYGWMIGNGPVDGRGKGMAQMFQMMNEERLNTGTFALGCIGSAYYAALDYCKIRVQSPRWNDPKGPSVRIIEHEDVRRMLMFQKAIMEACRALLYSTYYYQDLSHDASDEAERKANDDMTMIQIPLCKAYVSDMAWISTEHAIQCLGGYGFIEEYAPAEMARDCKIYSLWEGTNFMHAQDFTGRKSTMDNGEPMKKWLGLIEDFIATKKDPAFAAEFAMLEEVFAAYKEIAGMVEAWRADRKMIQIFGTRVLHAASMTVCSKLMLDQALLAAKKLAELGDDHFDANFYKGKIATAKFYVMNVAPAVFGTLKAMKAGDTSAVDCPEDGLM